MHKPNKASDGLTAVAGGGGAATTTTNDGGKTERPLSVVPRANLRVGIA